MSISNEKRAEEYYQLIGEKRMEGLHKYLDQDVEFYSPLATLKGKDAVIESTKNFREAIKSLKIRAKLGSEDQAMIVYDVDFPGVECPLPGASLLTFQNNLIARIELFHDASRFTKEF